MKQWRKKIEKGWTVGQIIEPWKKSRGMEILEKERKITVEEERNWQEGERQLVREDETGLETAKLERQRETNLEWTGQRWKVYWHDIDIDMLHLNGRFWREKEEITPEKRKFYTKKEEI
jgi:hypothetical protein